MTMSPTPRDEAVPDTSSVEKASTNTSAPNEAEPVAATDESKYITGLKLYLINAGLTISIFLVTLESTVISTAIVDITDELGGYEKSSWLFTAYMLTYCSLQMIWAKLSDIAGRKYTLIASLLIFTIFSALCGASQTLIQLIMFRWCQGIGGCGVYALTQLMFMEIAPPGKLPKYMAGVSMVLALSLITGPLLGGGITLHGSWRWIFLLNVPVGVLTAVSLCFTLPRTLFNEPAAQQTHPIFSKHSLRRLDFLGATLMLGTLVLLATGLQQASLDYEWSSNKVLPLLVVSAPFAIAFFTWQWYATQRRTNPEPVFPWRFCQSRIQLGMIINTYLSGTVMFVCIAQIPQRFITVNGLSPLAAAARLLTYGAFVPFGSGIAGAMMGKPRIPPCWIILGGSLMEILGIALLSQIDTSSHIDASQYAFQIIAGTGTGLVNSGLILLVPYAMDKRDLAVGSAATSQFRTLGGLVGIAIVTSISTPYIRTHLTDILPLELAESLLERTELVQTLSPETLEHVRRVFGEAYNLQVKVLIGFAVAKVPVTGMMWTNLRVESK
ncbi:MFS multidrug transporter-like protein [Alternaria rosae]|uniref:MFS multidrug transporter-like protein n=1 Tax=Alternaria rosae TaxID=1187941 RepID=UPI001E8E0464|nr:MFS multidrug transporter-like protein [Alternaria rosae]KAH6865804.1 MFS multidrug transporter-like protein [Alternaria rosae]